MTQMDAPADGQFQDDRYGPVETATSTPSVHYVNESGVPDDEIFNNARFNREVASVIEKWTQSLNSETPTSGIDIFARTKWQNAKHPFALMSQCAWAVENDDILSTLADVVEGLTFKKMRFELNDDDDQQDMWNQWAAEVDLDSRLREQSRELFKVSQFYVGLWWERRIYNVRDAPVEAVVEEVRKLKEAKAQAALDGTPPPTDPPAGPGKGNRKRKKKFVVEVPTAFTIFDPTKVMPVGTLMFGRERFAYIADRVSGGDQPRPR
jgi:hypothetical protein